MPARVDRLLQALVQASGSDLHLAATRVPLLRVHGDFQRINGYPELSGDTVKALLCEIMNADQEKTWQELKDVDLAHTVEGVGRFRVNAFFTMTGPAAVFRVIPSVIPTADDLRLPPAIRNLARLHKGLLLVTGATGSGKSTTLAALVDIINKTRAGHILTIEDPVEFVHEPNKCHVNQRELGTHAHSFPRALKAALREDPDVILVGELRDLETMELATTAAETGHLVLGTLHTSSAHKTLDRIISSFPGDKQNQMRGQLAETLRGVVAQQLIRRADGKGRVAAFEIMLSNTAVQNHVRKGTTEQIPGVIMTSSKDGMVTMDRSLAELVRTRAISEADGMARAHDVEALKRYLRSPNEM